MSWDRFRSQQKLFFPAVVLLVLIYGLEMFLSARLESQTFDEPAHLYAGYSYWLRSDFGINPEHPPLVKLVASLPTVLWDKPKYPEPRNIFFRAAAGRGGVELMHADGSGRLLNHGRAAVSIFAFLLAGLVTIAAWEMFGNGAALFALTLLVFDPMLAANGPLIATDVGVTLCIFAAVYAFYRWAKRPSLARLGVCGLATGLTLAAKHSGILLCPILILLSAVEVVLWQPAAPVGDTNAPAGPAPWRGRVHCGLRFAAALLAISASAIAILWAFYGFRYAARPGGAQIVPPTAVYLKGMHQPMEAKTIAFCERHHLLPEAYLYGLTDVVGLGRDGRAMYLFGKMYPEGRWFYFPAAFLIKSTIGFLLLLLLVPFSKKLWQGQLRREVLFMSIPPVFYFGFAMTSKLDIGIRHVMPVMPFLMVLAAAGAVHLAQQSRVWAGVVCILLALDVGSSLKAFPNYLPYSNEFFGGPNGTYRVLSDSNVGWGGGLNALHAYIVKRNIGDCWLAYFALPDPADFQIPCKRLPTFFSMLRDNGEQQAVPAQIHGPVFVSEQETAGSFDGPEEMNPYQQFAGMRPAHLVAGEILEFDGTFDVNKIAAVSQFVGAVALLRQHKVGEAVLAGERAVALDPSSLLAHEILSQAYTVNHQAQDAMREYQTALHLYETVHPEFQNTERPPVNPLAPPRQ